ncbi:unnamed protein product [Rotaria socialis]
MTTSTRHVHVIGGPNSAFARLFPDKYQQQQEIIRKQRSKSIESERLKNSDRITPEYRSNNNHREIRRKSCRIRFCPNEDDRLKTRTRSEPYLNQIHLSSDYSNRNVNYDEQHRETNYRNNSDKIIYNQRVGIRYLRPPTPPSPGPLVFREIQSTPTDELPPLLLSTTPPIPPRTPSPIVVRERPPTPPEYQPTEIITKKLLRGPTPLRRVILRHASPLPAKPRPVIIEKWLPYKEAKERRVLYQRMQQTRPAQHNLIFRCEPPQVKIKQKIEHIGCFRVDPKVYTAQYGSTLRRTDSIRRVLENIGCNANLLTSNGYQNCYLPTNNSSYNDNLRTRTSHVSNERLNELLGSPILTRAKTTRENYYDVPKSNDDDPNYTKFSSATC